MQSHSIKQTTTTRLGVLLLFIMNILALLAMPAIAAAAGGDFTPATIAAAQAAAAAEQSSDPTTPSSTPNTCTPLNAPTNIVVTSSDAFTVAHNPDGSWDIVRDIDDDNIANWQVSWDSSAISGTPYYTFEVSTSNATDSGTGALTSPITADTYVGTSTTTPEMTIDGGIQPLFFHVSAGTSPDCRGVFSDITQLNTDKLGLNAYRHTTTRTPQEIATALGLAAIGFGVYLQSPRSLWARYKRPGVYRLRR